MFRPCFLLTVGLGLAASAAAQNPIQWSGNVKAAVAQSRRTLRPLLFYVRGAESHRRGELAKAQGRAFRDPTVRSIAEQRFVPVRLSRTNENLAMLRGMGVADAHGPYLVVVSPDGELVGRIAPIRAAIISQLVRELTVQFRSYRTGLFHSELKPKLEDDDTPAGDIKRVLSIVREFVIVESDQSVITLLDHPKLAKTLEPDVYDTLAVLSTPKSAQTLFERALENPRAATALARSMPPVAEQLLTELDREKPERLKTAYEAATKICALRKAKPKQFWDGPNEDAQVEEIERVKREVRAAAKRWRERYADVR